MNEEHLKLVLQEIIDAVQTLAGLATRLRRDLGVSAEQAVTVEAAVDKAVRALRRLQPNEGRTK